jgi:hypothetical protein
MPNFSSDSRGILNKRVKIRFVEPPQVPGEQAPVVAAPPTVEEAKLRTQKVIQDYKKLEKLADLAQKRIDLRSKEVRICLNPTTDPDVLGSLTRVFGTNDGCITFEQYKHCLDILSRAGRGVAPKVTEEDIKKAATDPFRKNFGGYGLSDGQLRPERQIESPVKPLDMDKFQSDSLKKLFELLLPLLNGFSELKMQQHVIQYPGHFT